MARTPPPTVDRLRKEIDRGQTADKAPGVDPAAAPLGTDDEAGDHPPTAEQQAMEAEAQRREAPRRPTAGAVAMESLGAAESAAGDARLAERRGDAARPSEGGGAAESARAGETVPSREDEAAGALSDDPDPPSSRPSSEP
jgi:hypothetical protein